MKHNSSLLTEDVQQEPNHNSERRSRALSLGTIFSRNRCRQPSSEHYTIDFWSRNFADKNQITWLEFRAAFVLDYKHSLEEFWDKGRLSSVLDMARDQLCNKDSVVHITRYRKFVGSDSKPDAIWNKIREEATRLLFEEAVENSLCL